MSCLIQNKIPQLRESKQIKGFRKKRKEQKSTRDVRGRRRRKKKKRVLINSPLFEACSDPDFNITFFSSPRKLFRPEMNPSFFLSVQKQVKQTTYVNFFEIEMNYVNLL